MVILLANYKVTVPGAGYNFWIPAALHGLQWDNRRSASFIVSCMRVLGQCRRRVAFAARRASLFTGDGCEDQFGTLRLPPGDALHDSCWGDFDDHSSAPSGAQLCLGIGAVPEASASFARHADCAQGLPDSDRRACSTSPVFAFAFLLAFKICHSERSEEPVSRPQRQPRQRKPQSYFLTPKNAVHDVDDPGQSSNELN
jgi:hypothetical protein